MRDNFWRVMRVPIKQSDIHRAGGHPQQFQIQLDDGMGRSAYLCKKLECLQIAQKKKSLGAIATYSDSF